MLRGRAISDTEMQIREKFVSQCPPTGGGKWREDVNPSSLLGRRHPAAQFLPEFSVLSGQ